MIAMVSFDGSADLATAIIATTARAKATEGNSRLSQTLNGDSGFNSPWKECAMEPVPASASRLVRSGKITARTLYGRQA
jgi:hypothetical protein